MNELPDANIDPRTAIVGCFTSILLFSILELQTGCWDPIIIPGGKCKRIYLTTWTKPSRPEELALACMWAMSKFELTLVSHGMLTMSGLN